MVVSASRRFQQDGYAATGWRRVVAEADAPWGSQAHYFPGGKEELAAEALDDAGRRYRDLLHGLLEAHDPVDALRVWSRLAADVLVASEYADGCPIATVVLETAHRSPTLASAGDAALGSWRTEWEQALVRSGYDADVGTELATLIIAAIEGALILARAANSVGPIEQVARRLIAVLEATPVSAR